MSLYEHPNFGLSKTTTKTPKKDKPDDKPVKPKVSSSPSVFKIVFLSIIISVVFGFGAGFGAYYFLSQTSIENPAFQVVKQVKEIIEKEYVPQTTQEEKVIDVVEKYSPAVVSIIITKDVPIMESYYYSPFPEFEGFLVPGYRQKGTEKQEIGGGTGFIVSEDGLILTNKHVVVDEDADYAVFTNDGKSFSADVLARDPFQDLAIIKIEQEREIDKNGKTNFIPFPTVELGDSDSLAMGQMVVAIGNSLGEFKNTVSVGVISGLGRTITASGGDFVETLEDVIQTDAAINKGNSGGPLLNLKGEVVGINTAMVEDAQSVGFALPINKAKRNIEQVKEIGRIAYPFLGIRYILITEELKKEKNLSVDYGAWVIGGENTEAVFPGSAAEGAGIQEGDIVLEFNSQEITVENSLAKIINNYNPGDSVVLKVLRGEDELTISVVLGEREE